MEDTNVDVPRNAFISNVSDIRYRGASVNTSRMRCNIGRHCVPAVAPEMLATGPSSFDVMRHVVHAVMEPIIDARNAFEAVNAAGAAASDPAAAAEMPDLIATAADVRANLPVALALTIIAGASTGLGGILIVAQNSLTTRRLGLWQGAAAGFMASVSFFELLPSVLEDISPGVAAVYVVAGALAFLALRFFIPEPDLGHFATVAVAKSEGQITKKILWSGLVTAIGISVHNFPEGIAVCIASLSGIKVGLPLAIAIALHNLPEGAAVALPIYFATLDKRYAVKLAFASGMAEPLGVLFVVAAVHFTGFVLTKTAVAAMLAAVAGVMLIICIVELFPQARTHAGPRGAFLSTAAGLVSMTAMLAAIDWSGVIPSH